MFLRQHRIPELVLPELNGIKLKISESAKYLGIILDRRLQWNLNYADRINRESLQESYRRMWSFNPKMIYCIYTAIVRPTLLYGVWFGGLP